MADPTAGALTQARRRLGRRSRCGRCSICCAARPPRMSAARRCGGVGCWSARSTAPSERGRQRGELAVFTKQRGGGNGGSSYPHAAAGGVGGLRHPDHHRRGVRADQPAGRPPTPPAAGRACGRDARCWPTVTSPPAQLLRSVAATGADLLVRAKTGRGAPKLPVLRRLPRRLVPVRVRRVAGAGHRRRDHHRHHGRARTGAYRLITTLLDRRPLPGHRPGRALPRAVGDRDRLPGDQVQHPRRPGAARPHPGRRRAGDLRPAGHLPDPAHRDGRRHHHPTRHSTPTGPASPSP